MYFKRKVHCLVAFIISAFLCVTVLSACNQTEEVQTEETTITTAITLETTSQTLSEEELNALAQDMPEIVFVTYYHFPDELEYKTGKFIGTSGYFIDKNGNIKYFEFENEEIACGFLENTVVDKDTNSIYDSYSEYSILQDLNKKIQENSFETDYEPISKEKLIGYYDSLFEISNTKIDTDTVRIPIDQGLSCLYGVRLDENNNEEYLLLNEHGDSYFNNEDRYAEQLSEQLSSVLPRNKQ